MVKLRTRGLKADYNLSQHQDTIYFCTDTNEIILNGLVQGIEISGNRGDVLTWNGASNKALWYNLEDLFLDKLAYGVEWGINQSAPTCTRIGNPELHRTLPIQSLMKRCLLLDNGRVNYYLDPNNNTYKEGERNNILSNTDFTNGLDNWWKETEVDWPIVVVNKHNGFNAMKIKGQGNIEYDLIRLTVSLKPSTWYTLSFYAETTATSFLSMVCYGIVDASADMIKDGNTITSNIYGSATWYASGYHTCTFKTREVISTNIGNFVTFRARGIDDEIYISQIKLEEGTEATPWCKSEIEMTANLDGTDGQVMVELPECYWKFETTDTTQRVWMSLYPLPGFRYQPKDYVSAYEATLQRSTNKLSSVASLDPDYRGGNNKSEWDDTDKSMLGKPVTKISLNEFRTYAHNRGDDWHCYTYQIHKNIWWMYVVEYATRNSLASFNATLDANGYHQGGLGNGVTKLESAKWNSFNEYYPFIPCGYTNSLGNKTGIVNYIMPDSYDTTQTISEVPSYRGVENPFGHIWKWTDGILVNVQSNEAGGETLLYTCDDADKYSSSLTADYKLCGTLPRNNGYVKELVLGEDGEILPKTIGGGSSSYFCDNFYQNAPASGTALRGVLFGGAANDGALAGFVYTTTNNAPSYTGANFGSRLCYIPKQPQYQELTYIQSTGTLWIDTEWVPKYDPYIELKFMPLVTGDKDYYGFNNKIEPWFSGNMMIYSGSTNLYIRYYNVNYQSQSTSQIKLNQWGVVKHGKCVYFNDEFFREWTYSIDFSANELSMLLLRARPTSIAPATKVAYFKCWDHSKIVRDMVPVKRLSDNVLGMYDKITRKFFTNQGSGEFIAGDLIETYYV